MSTKKADATPTLEIPPERPDAPDATDAPSEVEAYLPLRTTFEIAGESFEIGEATILQSLQAGRCIARALTRFYVERQAALTGAPDDLQMQLANAEVLQALSPEETLELIACALSTTRPISVQWVRDYCDALDGLEVVEAFLTANASALGKVIAKQRAVGMQLMTSATATTPTTAPGRA